MTTQNTQNKPYQIYAGIAHSDALIHKYINEILNLFTPVANSGTVKIMSNADCKSKFGDTSPDYVNQLKRDLHGHANIRVQRNNADAKGYHWLKPEYYYVTSSVYFTENDMCLSLSREFVEKIAEGNSKYAENKFLLIDKEEKFHIIEYKDVAADFVKHYNDKDHCRNYNGNRNYLYVVTEPSIDMDHSEHQNAPYFENVHIGVTRYAKHIKGTPCKVRFYNSDGTETQTQVFNSTKEAFDKLCTAFDIEISYKTFIRLVQKNSLETFVLKGNGKEILVGLCLADEEPLSPVVSENITIDEFDAVVTSMKALDIVVEESDIYLMNALGMSQEDFVQYLLKKDKAAEAQYENETEMPETFEEHIEQTFVNPFKETIKQEANNDC